MMQFTQGWDWIQPTPDRNTGLWDRVTLEAAPSDVTIVDPWVRTLATDAAARTASVNATATLATGGGVIQSPLRIFQSRFFIRIYTKRRLKRLRRPRPGHANESRGQRRHGHGAVRAGRGAERPRGIAVRV
jgi:hypothetical protein